MTFDHPQYVDCLQATTQLNEADGFIAALTKTAQWCRQFHYADLPKFIAMLKACNAFEELPAKFRLLNKDGAHAM